MNQFIFKPLWKVCLSACEHDQDLKGKFKLDKFIIVGGKKSENGISVLDKRKTYVRVC